MKTVILAAGMGKRLGEHTNLKPKSLVKVGERPIIEHMIDSLRSAGMNDILIVVGYRKGDFEYLRELFADVRFTFIENPIYYKTNTAYSLWLARDHLRKGFFLFNGDVVFHPELLKKLIGSSKEDVLLIERKQVDEEEVKIDLVDGIVRRISKGIPLSEAQAEFLGILRFSKPTAEIYLGLLDRAISQEKMYNIYFDDVIEELAKSVDIHTVEIGNYACTEIDTEEDLQRARAMYENNMIKPQYGQHG